MLDRHLDVVLPQRDRAPKTIISYRSLCVNQIYPRWDGQRIDRLLPEQLADSYWNMLASGLAESSVPKVHAVLSSAYEFEVKRGKRRPQFVASSWTLRGGVREAMPASLPESAPEVGPSAHLHPHQCSPAWPARLHKACGSLSGPARWRPRLPGDQGTAT